MISVLPILSKDPSCYLYRSHILYLIPNVVIDFLKRKKTCFFFSRVGKNCEKMVHSSFSCCTLTGIFLPPYLDKDTHIFAVLCCFFAISSSDIVLLHQNRYDTTFMSFCFPNFPPISYIFTQFHPPNQQSTQKKA